MLQASRTDPRGRGRADRPAGRGGAPAPASRARRAHRHRGAGRPARVHRAAGGPAYRAPPLEAVSGRPWPWRDSARRSWRSRRWHIDHGRPVHPDRRHRGPHRGSRTTFASVSRTPARRQSKPGGHSVYEFASASRRSTAASRVSSRRSAPSRRRRGRCRRAPAWTGSNPSGHQVSRSARAPDRFARVMSARPRSAPRRSTPCNPARHSRQSRSPRRVRRRSALPSSARRRSDSDRSSGSSPEDRLRSPHPPPEDGQGRLHLR